MNKDMMSKFGEMQEKLQKAQEGIENRVAEGRAGGGAVNVEITGGYRVKSLNIDPAVIDPEDLGMLEDLISAAVNDALQQVQSFQTDHLSSLTGGLGIPGLPGAEDSSTPAEESSPLPSNRASRRASKR